MSRIVRGLCVLLLLPSAPSAAQPAMFPAPLSSRVASYAIAVTLNDSSHMLTGNELLTWKNLSPDAVPDLRFHLYLNAFRNSMSTFMKEGGSLRGIGMPAEGWGWIDVTSITTEAGEDLTPGMAFIHPDTDNDDDRTVLRVPLPRPVPPGATLRLRIGFSARLPRIFARTGYVNDFYMVGQWFPKIGVWESAGVRGAVTAGWNCHEFHPNTEFYADFGVYDVSITLPERYVVGATGVRWSEKKNADLTKTVAYHAEDVHDFSWTASPHFVEVTGSWRHVAVRAMMQSDHLGQASRYVSSAIGALELFDRLVGPYPYPVLTIVDPPYGGSGAGGMEYPTLITAGTMWGLPEGLRLPEMVTVHEFGHQYWYGMSASCEFEEAWLDEGLTQYYEGRIMDSLYGAQTSVVDLLGLRIGDTESARLGYASMGNPRIAPPATAAWKFPGTSYGVLTYQKTAVVLHTLQGILGTATMDSAMRTFFRRWRFRHPSGGDLVAVFNEIVPAMHGNRFGSDLNWYFDQTIFGTAVCDYEVSSISSSRLRAPSGIIDSAGVKIMLRSSAAERESLLYHSVVRIGRRGDLRLPVDVLVHFADGKEVTEQWDGVGTAREFVYDGPAAVRWAQVDPERKILLDLNMMNNSRTTEPPAAPIWKIVVKAFFWLQNLLMIFSQFA